MAHEKLQRGAQKPSVVGEKQETKIPPKKIIPAPAKEGKTIAVQTSEFAEKPVAVQTSEFDGKPVAVQTSEFAGKPVAVQTSKFAGKPVAVQTSEYAEKPTAVQTSQPKLPQMFEVGQPTSVKSLPSSMSSAKGTKNDSTATLLEKSKQSTEKRLSSASKPSDKDHKIEKPKSMPEVKGVRSSLFSDTSFGSCDNVKSETTGSSKEKSMHSKKLSFD